MHNRKEISISGDQETIAATVAAWSRATAELETGATVIYTEGYWHGARETGAIVRFDWPESDNAVGNTLWDLLVGTLALALPNERFAHKNRGKFDFEEIDLDDYRPLKVDYAAARYGSGMPAAASGDTAAAYWRKVNPLSPEVQSPEEYNDLDSDYFCCNTCTIEYLEQEARES